MVNAICKERLELHYRIPLLILLGSCFGFIRYATEGETYILPLFFSLWASYSALQQKSIFKVALLASIACLFHQIHFFWWLGLLFFSLSSFPGNKLKNFFLYSLPSWIVPVAYFLAFYFIENDSTHLVEFIFHDYMKYEDVRFDLNYLSIFLTPISFIRTFFQVHGYMYPLVLKYKMLWCVVAISISLFLVGCYKLKDIKVRKNSCTIERKFALSHLLIFILQLLFAFISDGNAEFMVMLPFALCLYLFFAFDFRNLFISYFAASIFLWNICLSVIPYHFLQIIPDFSVSRFIEEHPDEVFS
ncbi:MAG: hypothetical protein LUD02_06360 [Tannerellaceae bacterium]|nr:hypothetical protein [Tannerellaceae bacterium]